MRFLTLLTDLIEKNGSNVVCTDNGVRLLAPQAPPQIAEHFLYRPMPEAVLLHLITSYRRTFPEELLEFYTYANGLDLFRTMRKITDEISLPASRLSVYGVPLLSDRKHLEPFNISLEDLHHGPGTPDHWLKFGYFRDIFRGETRGEYDLYADTEDGKAYQTECDSPSLSTVRCWQSIDACLCDLFEYLSKLRNQKETPSLWK